MLKGPSKSACFSWNFKNDHTTRLEESSWEWLDQTDVMRGREHLKQLCCFDFKIRFYLMRDFFPKHHCFLPNFNKLSLLVVVRMIWYLSWMIRLTFISNLVPFHFFLLNGRWRKSLPFVFGSEKCQKAHQTSLFPWNYIKIIPTYFRCAHGSRLIK